ncbi:MAG: Smr/MutS family protein [Clostridia bacterium]|nr:Smr/MutS family protein [Clostridia bacterium]
MVDTIIQSRLGLILTRIEQERISFFCSENSMSVAVDLHGLSYVKGKRLLRNIINTIPFDCSILVIHGFNHGTVLKNMVRNDLISSRVVRSECFDFNPGVTRLIIRGRLVYA